VQLGNEGNTLRTKRVLITGGLGFVGQAFLQRQIHLGNLVRILDNMSNPSISRKSAELLGAEVLEGDIVDANVCREAVSGCDVVVHLAAQTYVAKSVGDPIHDMEINGIGSLNLLEASRQSGVQVIVAASSNAVAGGYPPPFSESAITKPISPYGCSKLAMEAYLHAYAHTHGIRTVALRFSNVYGPGSWRKGSVVASFLKNLLAGKGVTIHGDGIQTRDFLFIGDIVNAIALAIERGQPGSCFCIGSGTRTEILDLANRLAVLARQRSGLTTPIQHEESRVGDIKDNWSDISLARAMLGFSPSVDLNSGLKQTYDWFVENVDPISGILKSERM